MLLLALEDNERRMQRRLTKLLGVNRADGRPLAIARIVGRTPIMAASIYSRLDCEGGQSPRLVVVDVLARFRTG